MNCLRVLAVLFSLLFFAACGEISTKNNSYGKTSYAPRSESATVSNPETSASPSPTQTPELTSMIEAETVFQLEKFNQELNLPVIQEACVACHNLAGVASNTRLVFSQGNDLVSAEINAQVIENFTAVDTFFQKISAQAAHTGSVFVILNEGSVYYDYLEAFFNQQRYW